MRPTNEGIDHGAPTGKGFAGTKGVAFVVSLRCVSSLERRP